jgi:hypothetical protein
MTTDPLLPLRELARSVGHRRAGRPTHPKTLRRWHRVGLRGKKLRLVLVGGIWMGSEADLRSFIAATQPTTSQPNIPSPAMPTSESLEIIEEQLEADKW